MNMMAVLCCTYGWMGRRDGGRGNESKGFASVEALVVGLQRGAKKVVRGPKLMEREIICENEQ